MAQADPRLAQQQQRLQPRAWLGSVVDGCETNEDEVPNFRSVLVSLNLSQFGCFGVIVASSGGSSVLGLLHVQSVAAGSDGVVAGWRGHENQRNEVSKWFSGWVSRASLVPFRL